MTILQQLDAAFPTWRELNPTEFDDRDIAALNTVRRHHKIAIPYENAGLDI